MQKITFFLGAASATLLEQANIKVPKLQPVDTMVDTGTDDAIEAATNEETAAALPANVAAMKVPELKARLTTFIGDFIIYRL